MLKNLHFCELEILQLSKWDDIFRSRIAKIVCELVSNDKSLIVFCPTRKWVERYCKMAKKELKARGLPDEIIAPYRSGYKSDQRRDIESDLKQGIIKGVFCTNALEIGIDIGLLDIGILLGFPDTVMSAWQRAGRVGRSVDKLSLIHISEPTRPY